MTPSLKISQKIIEKISYSNITSLGKLYGIVTKNVVTVFGLEFNIYPERDLPLINFLPAEIYLCGVVSIGDDNYNNQDIIKALSEVYVTDNPIFIEYKTSTNKLSASFFINGQLEASKYQSITEQEILSQYLYLRLQATLPLISELNSSAIREAFTNLRKSVASGSVSFGFQESNVYLMGGEGTVVGVLGGLTIGELHEEINEPSEGNNRKKKSQNYEVEVVGVSMLKKMTDEDEMFGGKLHAPVCILDKKQTRALNLPVVIDALSVVHKQTKISSLYAILVESAIRNLRLLESSVIEHMDDISEPEIFHFYPESCSHFISNIYLKNIKDDSLVSKREKLHQNLLIDQTRPVFRRGNAFVFKSKNMSMPLVNPHEHVKLTDNGGRLALVKGKYQYYHYCQNKMDDNGWGCAYRSLQTLASWFKLQGHSDKEVPSFSEIQKCLVDIGDKPASFVGSRQWIGSTEVNFVLESLLGVTCKILYVSSGEEMGSKGPELVAHFENHGSPVMVGGGVLAHTILGVDYNSDMGNLKFLILDPHYTGAEDLQVIISKGWCGWKGVEFWDKTAYYNMCMPQVPVGI